MRAVYLIFLIVMISACQRNMILQDVGTEVDTGTVRQGKLVYKNIPTDSVASNYWKKVCEILPNELLDQYISSLRLYTDGKQEDLGGMNQMDETNENWQIDLDTADINFHNLDSSFVLT